MLDKGVDINSKNDIGESALNISLKNENIELANLLLNYMPDVDLLNDLNESAILLAVELNDLGIIKRILKFNPNTINEPNMGAGISPLQLAIQKQNIKVVKCLIKAGVDLEFKNFHSNTALYLASRYHLDYVKLLHKSGAKLSYNALFEAAAHGKNDIIRYLLSNGIDINSKNYHSALTIAIQSSHCQLSHVIRISVTCFCTI